MTPQYDFPTLHMHGNKDPWAKGKLMRLKDLFAEKADYVQFLFEGGHNFPKALEDDDYSQLA